MASFYEDSILIIGPSKVGKTTIANFLGEKTGMPVIHLKDVVNGVKSNIHDKTSDEELNACAIKKVTDMYDQEPIIIDFEAKCSIYENSWLFSKVKEMLAQFKNVVLLIPSINMKESLEVIKERITSRDELNKNYTYLLSDCNNSLATIIIFTKDKNMYEITDEILEIVNDKKGLTRKLEPTNQ